METYSHIMSSFKIMILNMPSSVFSILRQVLTYCWQITQVQFLKTHKYSYIAEPRSLIPWYFVDWTVCLWKKTAFKILLKFTQSASILVTHYLSLEARTWLGKVVFYSANSDISLHFVSLLPNNFVLSREKFEKQNF